MNITDTIKTKLGTLYVEPREDDEYPGFLLGLERNGVRYEFAWLEVDQSDPDDEPVMKIHAFGTEDDDPIFDKNITEAELIKLYKEDK